MANKKEREYMSKVANLGCWICEAPANVHHIRPKGLGIGRRSSHYDTIPTRLWAATLASGEITPILEIRHWA